MRHGERQARAGEQRPAAQRIIFKMNVVVVESPPRPRPSTNTWARTTRPASYGHVRDLPSKDGSVDPDDDFAMIWEVDPKAAKRLADIADAVKGADRLILATDPDREGEAISWHVLRSPQPQEARSRTPRRARGVQRHHQVRRHRGDAPPRDIDMELVDAYLARRALDYLVGFTLSPVLWRKLPGARSAGRVQSVALRLIVDREIEIEAVHAAGILDDRRASRGRRRSRPSWPGWSSTEGKRLSRLDLGTGAEAEPPRPALESGELQGRLGREEAGQAPPRRRPSPPRPCSRRPRASSASRRRAPCRPPSGSMKASTSAARRSA